MVSDKVTFSCINNCFVMKCFGDFADFTIEIERNTTDIENATQQRRYFWYIFTEVHQSVHKKFEFMYKR